jgi:hypothetical protein
MKTRVLLLILFFGIFLSISPASAQGSENPAFKKNSIYGSLGFAGFYGAATGNFERILTQSLERGVVATFVKSGLGSYGSWGDGGSFLYFQYGFLTGSKAGHLELSAGPNFTLKGDMNLPVAATLGYRLQRPGKGFMFRTGLALPESLYLGVGFSF